MCWGYSNAVTEDYRPFYTIFQLPYIPFPWRIHEQRQYFFRDLFLGGTIFDFRDTYAIRMLDREYDRRLILGFVVAIDNSVHDKDK